LLKRALLLLAVLAVLGAAGFVAWVGPKNIIGLLRYDQRHEGRLAVGDPAPDATLTALDGSPRRLLAESGGRPVVLVFGSYT
jgi:hypothetical protein